MNLRKLFTPLLAFTLVGAVTLTPISASAQSSYSHRQQTKNTWRNIGYGSAALGLYGLLTHQSTLAVAGAAGAGYSAYRYEQDRKSQRAMRDRYSSRYYSSYGQRRYRSAYRTRYYQRHRRHHRRHRRHYRRY